MLPSIEEINNLDELRNFVTATICHQYELQEGAFPISERILRRHDKPCGVYFCLHGPRATQFSAIWETDRNQILFYGSGGERFKKTQLIHGPTLGNFARN